MLEGPAARVHLVVLRRRAAGFVVLLAVAACVVGVVSARSAPTPGGVFVVTYEPQKLTSRASRLNVTFSTTGRAQPGWEYYAYLLMNGRKPRGDAKSRCAWKAASWVPGMVERVPHISGVAGGTYTIQLRAAKKLGGHFCAGRAVLEIGTGPTGHVGDRRRPLRLVTLRIAPAR